MTIERFKQLRDLVVAAEQDGFMAGSPSLTGYSGARLVGLLQRLAARDTGDDSCYVEVGVFQGMTLLSVAAVARDRQVYGIDNFSQFDVDNRNKGIVQQRMRDLEIDNAHLIDQDFEDALDNIDQATGGRKISTYFVDGPHDYRSQLMCLELAKDKLSDDAVIIVDDSNYQHVRQSSIDFLKLNPTFKLLFQSYGPTHPSNLDEAGVAEVRESWWNGITVMVNDPGDVLERAYPPADRDRTLFVNDHIVQSARLARFSPRAMRVASALYFFNPVNLVKQLVQLRREVRASGQGGFPPHDVLNTYSADLEFDRFNPSLTDE